MDGLGREIIRTINYETQEQTILLIFIIEYALPPNVLLTLQNTLNNLSTIDLEIIITRSLFEVNSQNHRVFRQSDITLIERDLMDLQGASGVLVRRFDLENQVQLDYEWFH